ncbi:B12-binding domain-containing radical SAM protein [Micromonospora sp. C95]|uniref:B12-binding domain-containing radical SAM protein n=1 Tax=Micromonospora sp. C95 TaxID=2824882 RepID=UPI001B36D3BE|nr:radical SAM protein [Micromonospora sp. C95]MBQ1026037.1 B12-binding domain-containing radical SAM protein [Micromonospora sp. C95]
MKRVTLVLPSSDEKRSSAVSQAGAEHLGIGYIAAYLRQRDVPVKILNFQVDSYISYWELAEKAPVKDANDCAEQILATEPEIVGMSITGITIREALDISYRLKELRPELLIVWGGHQAFYSARDLLHREPCVDAVVASDGEITMGRLVDAMATGAELRSITGLYLRGEKGLMVYTGPPPEPALDDLPEPARDTLEEMISRGMNITDARISTSRGCPFKCTFCVDPSLGYRIKWRARSAELVVQEMKNLVERYGIKFFWFSEDNFIPPSKRGRQRASEIADLLIESGLKVGYRALLRADAINGERELIAKLMRSGLSCVYIGVESGSPRRLEYFKKHESPEEYYAVLQQLREARVGLQIGFIMFDPFTSWQDLKIDGHFLHSVGQMYLYSNYCQTLDVFPGTEISTMLIKRGMLAVDFSYDSPYDVYDWEVAEIGHLGKAFMRGYTADFIEIDKFFQRFAVVDVPAFWRRAHNGDLGEDMVRRIQTIADKHLGTLNDTGLQFFESALDIAMTDWSEEAFDRQRIAHLHRSAEIRENLIRDLATLPPDITSKITCLTGTAVSTVAEPC